MSLPQRILMTPWCISVKAFLDEKMRILRSSRTATVTGETTPSSTTSSARAQSHEPSRCPRSSRPTVSTPPASPTPSAARPTSAAEGSSTTASNWTRPSSITPLVCALSTPASKPTATCCRPSTPETDPAIGEARPRRCRTAKPSGPLGEGRRKASPRFRMKAIQLLASLGRRIRTTCRRQRLSRASRVRGPGGPGLRKSRRPGGRRRPWRYRGRGRGRSPPP